MTNWLLIVVSVGLVALATAAPMPSNEEAVVALGDNPAKGEGMKSVAKRAEEMVYFGNQQNPPRVSSKKRSDNAYFSQESPVPAGQPDIGSNIVVHDETPVEQDLISRAEAVQGTPREEKLAEAMEIAKEKFEEAEKEKAKEETTNDLAAALPAAEKVSPTLPSGEDTIPEDQKLALLSNTADPVQTSDPEAQNTENTDVVEFLEELSKENGGDKVRENEGSNAEVPTTAVTTPDVNNDLNYYQTMYHILTDGYRTDQNRDFYGYNTMSPYYINNRRRRSLLRRRRNLTPIHRRSNRRVRRIKRDLPSDLLAAYRDIDLPSSYSNDIMEDALLSDPESSYDDEEVSRYIYANLLNKLANYGDDADSELEGEIPLEELLPYGEASSVNDNEIPESILEEYEPEELVYDPEISPLYAEANGDDSYAPYRSYSKRGGSDYRKRYFYPVYDEPETHWGAFVSEKRGYDDAIQRLQRLARALSDSYEPYYEQNYLKK